MELEAMHPRKSFKFVRGPGEQAVNIECVEVQRA